MSVDNKVMTKAKKMIEDKKIAVDNAVREIAARMMEDVKARAGRELSAKELSDLGKVTIRKALLLKAVEQVERDARLEEADGLADTILETVNSICEGNINFARYMLDKAAQRLPQPFRVYNKGVQGEGGSGGEIELSSDLAGLLDDFDLSEMVDDMTELRDNRKRDVTRGESKPKAEDDPIFAEIERNIPTLLETLTSKGDKIAEYTIKAIGKKMGMQVLKRVEG